MARFQLRNLELEIVTYHSNPTESLGEPRPIDILGYNMKMFDVLSLEAVRELFSEAGDSSVSSSEQMDGGEVIFGQDPDRNLLGFQIVVDSAAVSSQNFKDNGL